MSGLASLLRNVLVVSLALVPATTGCSAMSSRPPPRRPLVSPEECDTSRWPVVGDVYWAVNTASLALVLLGAAGIQYINNTQTVVPSWDARPLSVSKGLLIGGALSLAATVALGRSAAYGLDSARACDAAQMQWYLRMAATPPGPMLLPPPGPPAPPAPWPAR
jgi:hypothetical protein